jgi:hypothetical protein
MTIMDIDISNSGLTSSVDFLEKYSALHLSNELYESNFDSDKIVLICFLLWIFRQEQLLWIWYRLLYEPGYNSDEELEKNKRWG